MKAEEFSVWFSGVGRLSVEQRREVAAALADLDGGLSRAGGRDGGFRGRRGEGRKGAKRGRRADAWGRAAMSESQARLSALRGTRDRRLGTLAWAFAVPLQGLRAQLNALTKTAMAHLHKRERWFDHARAMIEGESLAKTAELCGVHPTTAFRWRHRFWALRPPTSLESSAESLRRTKPSSLKSFKGRWSDLPRKARKRGRRTGRASGPPFGQHSRSCRPRSAGRDLRRRPAAGRQHLDRSGAGRRRDGPEVVLIGDERQGDRRLRPQS